MQNYQILDWDSEILGFKVAKLLPERISSEQLQQWLGELKTQQVRLVYWPADSRDKASLQAAAQFQGVLADEKVTYLVDLAGLAKLQYDKQQVSEYPVAAPDEALEMLAIESGLFSRFNADPQFGHANFEKIYKMWIYNSTLHKVAEKVLVIKRDNKIVGMVTLGEKNQRGDIGLLAVDANYRGLQLGTTLVKAAQDWCLENGYRYGQVVTQKKNLPACALYEKCGYHIEKIENFYHFWL